MRREIREKSGLEKEIFRVPIYNSTRSGKNEGLCGPMVSGWLKRARQERAVVAGSGSRWDRRGADGGVWPGVLAVTALREAQPWLLVLLPAGGAVIWLVYARWGKECSRGMALVFDAEEGRREDVPLLLVPLAVGATWLGHLLGASVGREGVAVQIASAGASLLTPALQRQQDRRRLLVAGVAAGFAGLFCTPAGGGIFRAGTVPRGGGGIRRPAAGFGGRMDRIGGQRAAGDGPVGGGSGGSRAPALTGPVLLRLAVLGAACGLAGWLFVALLHGLKDRLGRWLPNPCLRIVLVGSAGGGHRLCHRQPLQRPERGPVGRRAMAGGSLYAWDWLAKLCLTAVCLAAGFQGGEVAPLFTIGAALGAVLALPLGLPVPLAAALAYAAVFAAGTNTLAAPILVGLELFGGEYFGCFVLVCAASYLCNGGHSIYPQAKS